MKCKITNIGKVRFVKYEEEYAKGEKQTICVITTLLDYKLETILKIMHSRWLIENNGFRVLKDRYNLDHCYIGKINAIRVINEIIMLVFNLMAVYIDVRTRITRETRTTKRILKKIFEGEILTDEKIYLMFETDIKASI